MKDFAKLSMLEQIRQIIDDFGLLPLVDWLFTMLDAALLTDFVKR